MTRAPDRQHLETPNDIFLTLILGVICHCLLWCLDRLTLGPPDRGALLAWVELTVQHPNRSILALSLAWFALLHRPAPRAVESAPTTGTKPSGLGRSASSD